MNKNNIINHAKEDEEDLFLSVIWTLMNLDIFLGTVNFSSNIRKEKLEEVLNLLNDMGEFVIEKNEPIISKTNIQRTFYRGRISFF